MDEPQPMEISGRVSGACSRRSVLGGGAAALALGLAGGGARAAQGMLRLGAAHETVKIPLPTDEFGTEHDPLSVRVALFDAGGGKAALIVVDLTSIGSPLAARWAARVARISGCPAENVLVCAGHSFSTPHVFGPGDLPPDMKPSGNGILLQAFETALITAATRAAARMSPVRIGSGQGVSRLAVSRDREYPGGWWLGANEAGFSDPALNVLRFDDAHGVPVAVFVNYAVQPSVLSEVTDSAGRRYLSADLTGAVARRIEAKFGDASTAFFLPGAGGDQSPYLTGSRMRVSADGKFIRENLGAKSFVLLDLQSERLADEALRVCAGIRMQDIRRLTIDHASVTLTGLHRTHPTGPVRKWTYASAGVVELPYAIFRLGNVAIVATAPELSASLGCRIRKGSPFAMTMVVTMVGNAAKYLPDRQGYDRFTYEALSAPFAPGSGEVFADAVVARLNQLSHRK